MRGGCWDRARGAKREGGEVGLVFAAEVGERVVAIGGGVALCSVTEEVVDGLGEEAAVEAEAGSRGSGVR